MAGRFRGPALSLGAMALAVALCVEFPAAAARPNHVVVRDRFSDEIRGKGPDLIFIPGLASSRDTWAAQASRLEAHYRVHLIQVAGFAGEPARANSSGDVLIPTAEAIDSYLLEAHLQPAILIGHSLGGTMTLYLAEHHPQHLKKALIVDALPFLRRLAATPARRSKACVQSRREFAPMRCRIPRKRWRSEWHRWRRRNPIGI